MSKRPRRNHAPAFKAKVALEAMKGDQTSSKGAIISSDKKGGIRSVSDILCK